MSQEQPCPGDHISTEQFDLVVIGTGAGGSGVAHRCAAAGWRVAIIDEQPYGGTCALRGCDPKKVLVGAADAVALHRHLAGHGLAGDARIDWRQLMAFKRSFTEPVPARRDEGLRTAGVATFHGTARFVDNDRIAVGDTLLQARHFVIASGSKPRQLDIAGEEHLITSTEFLDLDELPPRVAFIGAGYIGFEFAHVAHHAGSAVTLLGRGQPLPRFEPQLVDALVGHTERMGVRLIRGEVIAVQRTADGLEVRFRGADGNGSVEVDTAVHSGGRVPATDALNTAAAGIDLDEHGAVRVNACLQSVSNPRVYATGDAALPPGSLPLTPVGGMEGIVVASNLLQRHSKQPDYRGVASIVFTIPPLASAGLTEAAAREQGLDITVKSGTTDEWYSNRRVREPVGGYKTIVDRESGRLLGAHLLGHNADEAINVFALAIRAGLSADTVRHTLFGYPTSSSDAVYMM